MKKEIIYRTQISVNGILTKGSFSERRVLLIGVVVRCTKRKLLGFIPLPNCYKYEAMPYEIVSGANMRDHEGYIIGDYQKPLNEKFITFESRKRLAEERLNLEAWLRNKCKEYKMKM